MRRSDRELTKLDDILEVMKKCDVCRVALNDKDGYPYILPLNFGMQCEAGKVELFFHSATEGHKLDLIQNDSRASFEMDCSHTLQYFEDKGYCTFAYESVIGKGRIAILEGEDKVAALQALMDHYHPGKHAYFNPAAIPRTTVYKLTVETMTGKRKKKK
jgi:nitroimidazol reductase NimA-like FMN-containing flavoprotein (pyridoxamine 5'-phosphate oxidase superfamily)